MRWGRKYTWRRLAEALVDAAKERIRVEREGIPESEYYAAKLSFDKAVVAIEQKRVRNK